MCHRAASQLPRSVFMPQQELVKLIPQVIGLARKAGVIITEIYRRQFVVAQKSDFSPVTEADIASHELLVAGLEQLTPGIPVISEEESCPSFKERAAWEWLWLVDPLDGTREFIKRNDEFTINIALVQGGEAVLGVIYSPVSEMSYFACRGGRAYKQGTDGLARPMAARRWHGGHIVIAGSRSHRSERFNAFLRGFDSYEVISLGSSLKSCWVADGRADVYIRFGPTSEWDTAAAHCIVRQAGGEIMDLDMRPLRYNTRDSMLNPPFIVVGDVGHDWRAYLPD